MVICGHISVAACRSDMGVSGNVVHQMHVDYQDQELGGTGWLRLIEYQPASDVMLIRDYSPTFDKWGKKPNQKFRLDLSHSEPVIISMK